MTWIVLGYTAVAVALLWCMTCLFVYGSIDKEISADAWHWKLYTSLYTNPPRSDCRYARQLFILPFLLFVIGAFFVFFFGMGAVCCLVKDWIVMPIFFGERVTITGFKDYGQGLIGQQMDRGDYRTAPDRKKFLPFIPIIWIIVGICLFYAYHAGRYMYEHPMVSAEDATNPTTLVTLVIIALLFLFQKQIRSGLKSGWAKWQEKTCHRIRAPDMD